MVENALLTLTAEVDPPLDCIITEHQPQTPHTVNSQSCAPPTSRLFFGALNMFLFDHLSRFETPCQLDCSVQYNKGATIWDYMLSWPRIRRSGLTWMSITERYYLWESRWHKIIPLQEKHPVRRRLSGCLRDRVDILVGQRSGGDRAVQSTRQVRQKEGEQENKQISFRQSTRRSRWSVEHLKKRTSFLH